MKKVLAAILLVLLAIAASACGVKEQLMTDPASDELLQSAVAAIEARDMDAFFALFIPEAITEEQKTRFAGQIHLAFQGQMTGWKKVYQYQGVNKNAERTLSYVDCIYLVTTDVDTYRISTQRVELSTGSKGLSKFNIQNQQDYLNALPVGTLDDIGSFNAAQWGVLAFSLLCYGFIAFTLIHCFRHKMRKKWLFVLLCLGIASIQVNSVATQVWFGVNIGVALEYSYMLLYPNGSQMLNLVLPLGAILYWCIKKKPPKKKQAPTNEPVSGAESDAQQETSTLSFECPVKAGVSLQAVREMDMADLLKTELDFRMYVDGRLFFEDRHFPMLEFLRYADDWLRRPMSDFVYNTLESEENPLLAFARGEWGMAMSSAWQKFPCEREFARQQVVRFIQSVMDDVLDKE